MKLGLATSLMSPGRESLTYLCTTELYTPSSVRSRNAIGRFLDVLLCVVHDQVSCFGGDESLVAIEVSLEEPVNYRLTLRHKSWSGAYGSQSPDNILGWEGPRIIRRVDAKGIFRTDGRYFMVGYCHLRKGRRVFAIHRVIKAELLSSAPGRIIPPEGWDQLYRLIDRVVCSRARRAVLGTSLA